MLQTVSLVIILVRAQFVKIRLLDLMDVQAGLRNFVCMHTNTLLSVLITLSSLSLKIGEEHKVLSLSIHRIVHTNVIFMLYLIKVVKISYFTHRGT